MVGGKPFNHLLILIDHTSFFYYMVVEVAIITIQVSDYADHFSFFLLKKRVLVFPFSFQTSLCSFD